MPGVMVAVRGWAAGVAVDRDGAVAGKDTEWPEEAAEFDGLFADMPKSSASDESSLLLASPLKTMRFADFLGLPLLSGDGVSADARSTRLPLIMVRHLSLFMVEDEAIIRSRAFCTFMFSQTCSPPRTHKYSHTLSSANDEDGEEADEESSTQCLHAINISAKGRSGKALLCRVREVLHTGPVQGRLSRWLRPTKEM